MRCPKCGFHSFESNESCPKCTASLREMKQTYGIAPVVISPAHRQALAAGYAAVPSAADAAAVAEAGEQMFAFELSGTAQEQAAQESPAGDPFSFMDSQATDASEPPPAARDPFAELLETTPQHEPSAPAEAVPAASGQEFELSSFSWDEAPPAESVPAEPEAAPAPEDDFTSLFGDLGESKK